MAMKNLGAAATVGELLEKLKDLDPNLTWYGWDDGSIIIEEPDSLTDYGFIENKE